MKGIGQTEVEGALEVSMKRSVPADADTLMFSYPSFAFCPKQRRSSRTTVSLFVETCGRTAFRLSGEPR